MELKLYRISSQKDSTNGILYINNEFACYTLEDEQRKIKVKHETAIPLGIYEIEFRKVGGFHSRYLKRYGADFHKGMLELQDVPNFEYILIHTGNTDEHTSGCILVMDNQENNLLIKDGFGGKSRQAYERIYPKIASALINNEKVTIEIVDFLELEKGLNGVSDIKTDEVFNAEKIQKKLSAINSELQLLNAKLDNKRII